MPKVKHRSKRRVEPLKDADYDHEISLTDAALSQPDADDDPHQPRGDLVSTGCDGSDEHHDGQAAGEAVSATYAPGRRDSALLSVPTTTATGGPLSLTTSAAESSAPLLPAISHASAAPAGAQRGRSPPGRRKSMRFADAVSDGTPTVALQRAATVLVSEGEAPDRNGPMRQTPSSRNHPLAPESVVDALYENERGIFLCGIPFFSGLALGNLDPSPWTNAAQKTSITDIHTAQVPDPSWTWAWPEWRIYHDADHTDEDGWEYSFMFAKCFSWHGPTSFNSFVRRRVWIRKRIKRQLDDAAASAAASSMGLSEGGSALVSRQLLNPDYFVVLPAGSTRRSASRASTRASFRGSSRASSRGSVRRSFQAGNDAASEVLSEISNADVLLSVLRGATIDRERLNAMQSFLDHGGDDLAQLADMMHEIMALFVFQASRRMLVTMLTGAHRAAVRLQHDAAEARPETQSEQEKTPETAHETNPAAQVPAEDNAADGNAAQHGEVEKGKGKGKAKAKASTDGNGAAEPTKPVLDAAVVAPVREEAGRHATYLSAALKHAGEEVQRFEFWSDIKAVAQAGKGEDPVDSPVDSPAGSPAGSPAIVDNRSSSSSRGPAEPSPSTERPVA